MKQTNVQSDCRRARAFSLIEILVAVTLLTVITVGLLAMFYQTQKAFRLGTSQVDVLENGRATMQLICRDLQQMHTSNTDTITNFLARPSTTPRVVMALPGGGPDRENMFQDISFLTREGNKWSAISYRVHHDGQGAGTLYRAVLSLDVGSILIGSALMPRHQRDGVANIFNRVSQTFSGTESVTNVPPPAGALSVPPLPPLPPLVFDRVADGVVHFRVFAYTETGVLYTNVNYVRRNSEVYHMANFVPAYLDVELAIVDPKAMKQLGWKQGVDARNYLKTQAYRTHVFRQRINLRSRQLEHELFAAQ
jgi:hypothetical protein